MEVATVHLCKDYTATLQCPSCNAQRVVDVRAHDPRVALPQGPRMANVRCACGERFRASFEWRRAPRFAVHCPGQLLHSESLRFLANITVTSLSLHGVGFAHTAYFDILPGDIYTVHFRLAPSEREPVSAAVICRRVTPELIGAEGCGAARLQPGFARATDASLIVPATAAPHDSLTASVAPAGAVKVPPRPSRRELRAREAR